MKIYTFLFTILFLCAGITVHSQNVYTKDTDRVVEKVLGTDTISSNLSLIENLSKIPVFSRQIQIFSLSDFENLIENHQMVTVFVVKNNAFDSLDKEELDEFFSQSNKSELDLLQSYYILPGRVDEHAIRKAVTDGNGAASFRTLNNKTIRFLQDGESLYLYTDTGSKSKLLETNFYHSKGFFHITENFPIRK